MKTKLILKSLADLPANTVSLVASVPERAATATQSVFGPAVRLTCHEIHEAHRRSMAFARDLYQRANTPFRWVEPWPHGGINE